MRNRIWVRIVALVAAIALVLSFSACGLLNADTRKQMEKVQRDIVELGQKLAKEQDPATKERFQKELQEAQKRLGELVKKLGEESKGLLENMQKELQKATGGGK